MESSKNPTYILVDFAQIVHAAYHFMGLSHHRLSDESNLTLLENKVRQKLGTIRRCLKLEMAETVLVLDEHSQRKKSIYPAYKQNHGPHQVPVREVAARLVEQGDKILICVSPENEADDTIATLCARNRTGFNVVVSTDKDLWQLMNPNVRIFNPITKVLIEPSHVEATYGVGLRSHHVPLAKSLWGDAGDNVPIAIARSRKKLFPYVIQTAGSIEELVKLVEKSWDLFNETLRLNWMLGESQLLINYKLVKLDETCEILWDRVALARRG